MRFSKQSQFMSATNEQPWQNESLKNSDLNGIWTYDLCDALAVFYQKDIIELYKITKIVHTLWLAERRVCMRVYV